jgi:hypothetical protein
MNPLERHVAGATVQHQSPFSELQVPVSFDLLPADIRDTWVIPLYFGLQRDHVEQFVDTHLHLVTDDLVNQLLASFNWRPRTAGAYLVALTDRDGFTEHLGRLLLRSDVCYAGAAYCIALAELNNSQAVDFLNEYLAYYLKRTDLWFDQGHAMAALCHLDRANGTDNVSRHLDPWSRFIQNKSHWSLEGSISTFAEQIGVLRALKSRRSGS